MRRIAVLLALCVLCVSTLARGGDSPFAIRGIKGLWWEGFPKYRLALPWVASHNMNFLMFCYTSFPASAKDWRSGYSDEEIKGFEELARESEKLKVNLCLSFNPGLWSKPPLVYSSEDDFDAALKKVEAIHATGIRWFALCLDDIGRKLQPADEKEFGTLQNAQVHFVNKLWAVMKNMEPRPVLIFCPSTYTTQDAQKHLDYIETIGKEMDPEVKMFWTGPVTCSPTITAADAKKFDAWIRRKPIVWDNYPVNDMFPWRPLVAPVKGRSANLGNEVEGVMANPMKQWYASTIPLATLASYLSDPTHYDPAKALDACINVYPADDRDAIRALVDVYGRTFLGERGYPPGPAKESGNSAKFQLARYKHLEETLSANSDLEGLWKDVEPTLAKDLKTLGEK